MPAGDNIIIGAPNPVEGKAVVPPAHAILSEKIIDTPEGPEIDKAAAALGPQVATAASPHEKDGSDKGSADAIIATAADASEHLLSLRDDGEPALTFRGLFLATILACFQAVVFQIYQFKPTAITIQGTFIVLIAYFLGKAWTAILPRGDLWEARWRERYAGAEGRPRRLPTHIALFKLLNPGPWNLKEHAISAITATSASNASVSITVFTAQSLFYDLPLSATTVILSVISIGLLGYGLCGVLRPIIVWYVEAVYWTNLPTVKTLQGLHWQSLRSSEPLRWFWRAYAGMLAYEFLPAYVWPWLNSVSVPCLAAMHATGDTAAVLNNLFGGSLNNQGLGLFSVSLDWQYITSFQTSLPLKLQVHQALGFFICFLAMLGIYYTNAWDAKSQPFMSTRLRLAGGGGGNYPTSKVFVGGVLDRDALDKYGLPELSATFAYALFMANAAIGALTAHCFLFWGGDIVRSYRSARQGRYDDRHHAYMAGHYKEAPWWWYVIVLVVSFILGLVVVIKEDITLPVWAYIVALLLGAFFAPLSALIYSRYGNGIATNNLSKMLAGLLLPERPIGNMYFAAWSHNVIASTVNLSADLKMGEYLKVPPRAMFLTQIYGTVLGGFINYVVMTSVVGANHALLVDSDGSSSWSGATIQSFNTNAASWALARYLYSPGGRYELVPVGLAIGAGIVVLHRLFAWLVPRIRLPCGVTLSADEINMPQLLQYAGFLPYNQSQTCVLLSWVGAGFFVQFWLRNYRPRIFSEYSYLITGAFDGASLTVLFVLSFAVFGAGGPIVPFPKWWGNNVDGYPDLCPSPDA